MEVVKLTNRITSEMVKRMYEMRFAGKGLKAREEHLNALKSRVME